MITLKTNYPIAIHSPDHIMPQGTRKDNSRNPRFNWKLLRLFKEDILHILDLGCAGGGFVRDMINAGHIAVGLGGSDWSKKHRRAEWATIPDNLFTCDITKPFDLSENGVLMKFDVITAWETLEHIKEDDLPQFFKNINAHLKPNGLFIASTSPTECEISGYHLHQTIKSGKWWGDKLRLYGLYHDKDLARYFGKNYVRYSNISDSFVCTLANSEIKPLHRNWREKLWDRWIGSLWQKRLQRFVNGYNE